ncbi:hypothetical protein RFI_05708 [Reticulomyxa filosa]|uniref:IBR domain-containing protein n=1 Tax=Reticulomyxa filosa TaxID=46433 RepID=X6NZX1_RETFI|nr:hypothetical protein RFI_05708 [Reticulomyxa filosa]|eukprot:ETO31413.1 hypothetical protein RFI_05708 [Reticulomyxa filosa]
MDEELNLGNFVAENVEIYKNIVVNKSNQKRLMLKDIPSNWTLQRFLEELKDKDSNFAEAKSVTLYLNSHELNDKSKTLAQLGFKDNSMISTVWHVLGGTSIQRQYPKDLTTWPKNIIPVKDGCFSHTYELVEGYYNAKISCCGTVTSAETAYNMLKNEINNRRPSVLKCQFSTSCGKSLSFSDFAWLAQLTPEENKDLMAKYEQSTNKETEISPLAKELLRNSKTATISGIANVPTLRLCLNTQCRAMIQWTERCKHVKCPDCKGEFCMICLVQWKPEHSNVVCTVVPN